MIYKKQTRANARKISKKETLVLFITFFNAVFVGCAQPEKKLNHEKFKEFREKDDTCAERWGKWGD